MLTITDATTGKTRKYATTDAELINSLFNDGAGTLDKLHKKETHGDALYGRTKSRESTCGSLQSFGASLESLKTAAFFISIHLIK